MRRLAIVAVIVIAAAGAAWLLMGRGGGGLTATPAPSIGVVPPSDEVVADGRVVPVRFAELQVGAPGKIVEVLVAEGDTVAAGAPLLRLDPTTAEAEVAGAVAALESAGAGAARAAAGVTQASAAVEAADAAVEQARAGWNRARAVRDGLPSGASGTQVRIAGADVDAAAAALEAARANLRSARSAVIAAARGSDGATADVARATAGLAAARQALAAMTLTAPFAGEVASLDARVGEQASPGLALARVADTSGWRIETTDLDETTVVRVATVAGDGAGAGNAVGARVTITFDGLAGVTVEGTIESVALFGSPVQGDVVYRAIINPSTVPNGLRWNMTATVTVRSGT